MPESIQMINSAGETKSFDPKDADAADTFGFRPITPEEQQKKALQETFNTPEDKFQALVEGGLDSVPFVGGALQDALGIDPAKKEIHKNLYPGLRDIGSAASIGLQAIVPESPVNLIGSAAGKVAGLAESVLPKFASSAVSGAAAGSLFEAGKAVNEITLGDPNITMEKVASQMGTGALLGGAIGGMFGAVSSATQSNVASDISEKAQMGAKWIKRAAGVFHPGTWADEAIGKLGELAKTAAENPEELPVFGKKLEALKYLKPIAELKEAAERQIKSAISHIFSSKPVQLSTSQLGAAFSEGKEENQKTYEEMKSLVQQYRVNPAAFSDNIATNTLGLYEHAPNITVAAHRLGNTAMQYLSQVFPDSQNIAPLTEIKPTSTQIANFAKSYQVVEKPLSILPRIRNNQVSDEEIRVFKTIYPNLHKDLSTDLLLEIGKHQKKIGYQTRLGLSRFLGVDLDGSKNPLNVASNQQIYSAPSRQAENQSIKPSQKGLDKLTLSERYKTPLQKSAERGNDA